MMLVTTTFLKIWCLKNYTYNHACLDNEVNMKDLVNKLSLTECEDSFTILKNWYYKQPKSYVTEEKNEEIIRPMSLK